MHVKHRKTPRRQAPALALTRQLPTLREWAEARPAVDPVLVQRLRGEK